MTTNQTPEAQIATIHTLQRKVGGSFQRAKARNLAADAELIDMRPEDREQIIADLRHRARASRLISSKRLGELARTQRAQRTSAAKRRRDSSQQRGAAMGY